MTILSIIGAAELTVRRTYYLTGSFQTFIQSSLFQVFEPYIYGRLSLF